MCATMWRRRTATANSAWHRSRSLRKTLFEEFKSHVQETDMSVPTRMDGYWYFTRTKQGEQYAVQCRVPIRGADDWGPPTVEAGGATRRRTGGVRYERRGARP